MANTDSGDMPFMLPVPKGCEMETKGQTVFIDGPGFHLNVIRGRYSGPLTVPLGWIKLSTDRINSPEGPTDVVEAHLGLSGRIALYVFSFGLVLAADLLLGRTTKYALIYRGDEYVFTFRCHRDKARHVMANLRLI